jgi:hypothetical protein
MKDFFVSYTARDRQWAEWIAWELEEAGQTVQIQAWDFVGNWVLLMDEAMRETARTIAVLSPHFFESRYTPSEWANAFRLDPTGEKDLLIPVRVAEVELKGIFAQLTYVDLVGLPEAEASERLLKRVRGERGKPSTKPAFPFATQFRTITTKPAYPAYEEDMKRLARAQELLVKWRGLYKDHEDELREGARKARAWSGARPAEMNTEVTSVLELVSRVSRDLRELPVQELEFAKPYGLQVHDTVFWGHALHFADTASNSPLMPSAYSFEMIERLLDSAVALLRFRLDALPQGYVESTGATEDLRRHRTLLVARIDYEAILHLVALDPHPSPLGTFGARRLTLTPLCARRNREGTLDLVAEDAHNVYIWSGSEGHPSAQYLRDEMTLAASFLPNGNAVAVDACGQIRILDASGGEETVTHGGQRLKDALVWTDPREGERWHAVSVTSDFGLISHSRRGQPARRSPETLWGPSRDWSLAASLVPGTVDGFPCVVVHRSALDGGEGVNFVDPVSLQSIRSAHFIESPITSMVIAGGRWLVVFMMRDKHRIAIWDLTDSRKPASRAFQRHGEVYEPFVATENDETFEVLFVLHQYDVHRRILCRFCGPSGDVEELRTFSDLRILPVEIERQSNP